MNKNNFIKIKIKILEKGLTQKEVANQIGITENTLSRWINGKIGNIEKFLKLCHMLDLNLKDFYK